MKFRIYDDRNNETLFASENKEDCLQFIHEIFDEGDEDFLHVWLEDVK